MSRPRKVVLCLGANEHALSLRKFLFETRGFQVLVAQTHAEAVELYRLHRVDLIVAEVASDLHIWDGTLVDIRSLTVWTATPVLVTSAKPATGADPQLVDGFISGSNADLVERVRIMTSRKRGPKSIALRDALLTRYA